MQQMADLLMACKFTKLEMLKFTLREVLKRLLMNKITLQDVDIRQKKVLMRVDFNVPLSEGKVANDTRIVKALPSLREVISQSALLILMSHLDRPGGKVVPELSLKPAAEYLRTALNTRVYFADDCVGEQAEGIISQAQPGEVVLLENVRFHPQEKENDVAFSKKLAAHADVFVNNAFGTSHRKHASVAGVAEYLQPAVAGFLLKDEIEYLEKVTANPHKPYVAVIGGAKVSDKINVIEHLLEKVDTILIGGGMVYTFYKAQGVAVGDSLVEEEKIELACKLLKKAEQSETRLILPFDSIAADGFDNEANQIVADEDNGIEEGWLGLDIGPQTAIAYGNVIKQAKTVVWFGPMGVYEMENFAGGTESVAEAMAEATRRGATTLVGGGDSAAAIQNANLEDKVSHVSTGGGASLMYLEGKELPGVAALTDI